MDVLVRCDVVSCLSVRCCAVRLLPLSKSCVLNGDYMLMLATTRHERAHREIVRETCVSSMATQASPLKRKDATAGGQTAAKSLKAEIQADASQPQLTLGAPRAHPRLGRYETAGGISVDCERHDCPDANAALEAMIDRLDSHRGCLFESSYDFPGRYARWTMGFCDPPLALEARGRSFDVTALNSRGRVLLPAVTDALRKCDALGSLDELENRLRGTVKPAEGTFTEEERSRQHSIFSIVRALQALFHFDDEPQLGLYGAFGYDLTFQFESVKLHQQRDDEQRDLVLFLPDEILVIDILSNAAWKVSSRRSSAGAPC